MSWYSGPADLPEGGKFVPARGERERTHSLAGPSGIKTLPARPFWERIWSLKRHRRVGFERHAGPLPVGDLNITVVFTGRWRDRCASGPLAKAVLGPEIMPVECPL